MIFQLRWSDIFVKTKVILKPSVSVILYLPLNCAKHNITRRKPNITAQQYNLPQANITEKTTCRNKSFFLEEPNGLDATSKTLILSGFAGIAKNHFYILIFRTKNSNPRPCFLLHDHSSIWLLFFFNFIIEFHSIIFYEIQIFNHFYMS